MEWNDLLIPFLSAVAAYGVAWAQMRSAGAQMVRSAQEAATGMIEVLRSELNTMRERVRLAEGEIASLKAQAAKEAVRNHARFLRLKRLLDRVLDALREHDADAAEAFQREADEHAEN